MLRAIKIELMEMGSALGIALIASLAFVLVLTLTGLDVKDALAVSTTSVAALAVMRAMGSGASDENWELLRGCMPLQHGEMVAARYLTCTVFCVVALLVDFAVAWAVQGVGLRGAVYIAPVANFFADELLVENIPLVLINCMFGCGLCLAIMLPVSYRCPRDTGKSAALVAVAVLIALGRGLIDGFCSVFADVFGESYWTISVTVLLLVLLAISALVAERWAKARDL